MLNSSPRHGVTVVRWQQPTGEVSIVVEFSFGDYSDISDVVHTPRALTSILPYPNILLERNSPQ